MCTKEINMIVSMNKASDIATPVDFNRGITGNAPIKSEALLAGTKELVIDHLGKLYKLRLTSLGKLILTT